jgi:hypothetical protein
MDFDIITESAKKAFDNFVQNIVAYIVGLLIACIGSMFIITSAPLFYGLYYMVLKGTRGEKVEIKDVFYGFSSGNIFIRSWIGFIGIAIAPIVLWVIVFIIIAILTLISPTLAVMLGMLLYLVLLVAMFVLAIFLYYAIYIYIMTPSENIVYAIKESISIGKANIIMMLLTIIIASVMSCLWVTTPLGMVFAAYVLKELKPDLKDGSGI